MQTHRLTGGHGRRLAVGAGTAAMLAVAVSACGSGSGSGPSAASTPTAAPSSPVATPSAGAMPAKGAAAKAAIRQDWTTFFNAKTGTAQRLDLLQNGQELASAVRSQANSSLAGGASAKVNSVTLTSPAKATVNYSVLLDGKAVLKHKTGTAVYKDGTWKVGDASFCGLLGLENNSNLPAACRKA